MQREIGRAACRAGARAPFHRTRSRRVCGLRCTTASSDSRLLVRSRKSDWKLNSATITSGQDCLQQPERLAHRNHGGHGVAGVFVERREVGIAAELGDGQQRAGRGHEKTGWCGPAGIITAVVRLQPAGVCRRTRRRDIRHRRRQEDGVARLPHGHYAETRRHRWTSNCTVNAGGTVSVASTVNAVITLVTCMSFAAPTTAMPGWPSIVVFASGGIDSVREVGVTCEPRRA